MKFGNVETNIKTEEDRRKLLTKVYEWYVNLRYPGYKIISIKFGNEEAVYGEVTKETNR